MSIIEQLSQILDQYYNPNKNLKNIEEKKVDFSDNQTLKKINFSEQKMMTKSSSKQEQQSVNQKLEQLNYKKAEHDFEFEKKYKPRILHWSVWILIGYLSWLACLITFDYCWHINDASNRLSNPVIIALASSTAVAIVGLPSLIVKSLFK